MPKKKPPTLQQILGRNLRRLRKERGWTQDDLAKIARQIGLGRWTQATVAAIESGRREVLEEMLVLQAPLGTPLSKLLETDEPEVLVAGIPVPGKALRRLAQGQRVFRARSTEGMMAAIGTMQKSWFRERRRTIARYGLATDDLLLIGDLELAASGDAEGKAARTLSRRLGVEIEPFEVAAASSALWDRSLSEERDRRLADGASPQSAGHVTRTLLAELEARIRQRRRQRRRG